MTDKFVITETLGVREVHGVAGVGDYDTLCGYDPAGDLTSRLIGTTTKAKINCEGCAGIIRIVRNTYTLRDIEGSE